MIENFIAKSETWSQITEKSISIGTKFWHDKKIRMCILMPNCLIYYILYKLTEVPMISTIIYIWNIARLSYVWYVSNVYLEVTITQYILSRYDFKSQQNLCNFTSHSIIILLLFSSSDLQWIRAKVSAPDINARACQRSGFVWRAWVKRRNPLTKAMW